MLKKLLASIICICVLFGMLLVPASVVEAVGAVYYVDGTNGLDTYDGTTLQTAFKTIQKAADVAQAGDTVYIREGVYREANAVTPANSGTEGNPITFTCYNNESVTISGAEPVSGWTQYSGNIYRAPLSWDLEDENQVFIVNGSTVTPCWEARWPNISAYNLDELHAATVTADAGSASTITDHSLTQAEDYWVGGTLWCRGAMGYLAQTSKITDFNEETDTLTFNEFNAEYPCWNTKYYISGVLAELDTACEWYIDSSYIYLQVPGGGVPSDVQVKKRMRAFDLEGKDYINIKNIKIFASSINMQDANHCSIDGITAEYIYFSIDSYSYVPSNQEDNSFNLDGDYNEIKNSDIGYSSGALIKVNGDYNRIVNNHLHDSNYLGGFTTCIDLKCGKDILISHNTMNETGRSAVYFLGCSGGCNANIQYNHIYDINKNTIDAGAIYGFGVDFGNGEIHHNIIHDDYSEDGGIGAIYPDNFSANLLIHHNLIYNFRVGLRVNSPTNHILLYNNTVICEEGVGLYGAGTYQDENYDCRWVNNVFTGSMGFTEDSFNECNINVTGSDFVNAAGYNYNLAAGSSAINTGVIIPGITDGYTGSAPDCGAFEYGGSGWTAGHDFSNPSNPTFTATDTPYKNLVKNSAFELLNLANWTKTGACNAETVIAVETEDPLYLERGVFFNLRLGGGIDGVYQTITGLDPDTTYKLSGCLLAESGETVALSVYDYGGSTLSKTDNREHYIRKEIVFTTGSSNNSATVYIDKTSVGPGYVYADDLGLTESKGNTDRVNLEAANYDAMQGITNSEPYIESCDDGDWVCYNYVDLGDGFNTFEAEVGASYNPGNVEIRLGGIDGTLVGTLPVSNAGLKSTTLTGASGVHNIYLKFTGGPGVGDFVRFRFSNTEAAVLEIYDYVDAGDSESEAAHNIQCDPRSGAGSETGYTRRYAMSQASGSWFSYDVKVPFGTDSIKLDIRETGNGEALTRDYNIYLDGVLLEHYSYNIPEGDYVNVFSRTVTGLSPYTQDGKLVIKFEEENPWQNYDPSIADIWVSYSPHISDDFSNGLSQWVNTDNCSISNGKLTITNNENMRSAAGGPDWTDYTFEADVKVTDGAAGLVFRSTDNDNFYMWQLNAETGKLRPHKKVNGNWTIIKEVDASISLNTEYHVKIEAIGSTIKTYFGDTLIDTTIDTTFSSGKVGFREADADEEAVFDNVVVNYTPVFLEDDISNGTGKWMDAANCSISNGQMTITNNENMRSLIGGSDWTDYIFETDVKVTKEAAGLVFRSLDSNNFYMWQLDATTGKLRPHKKVNGNWTLIKEINSSISLNTLYHVKIEAKGSTIKTYIDGTLIDTTIDTTFGSGKVGFRLASTDEEAVVDNVAVKNIPVLLKDDFSIALNQWINTANCSISNGQLTITNNEDFISSSGGSYWTNYSFEADVKVTKEAAGLIFRSTDSNNFYMWQLNALTGKLWPHKKVNGNWAYIKEVNASIALNTVYHVRIEANGSTIKTYIDGTLIDTTVDTTFSNGKVGIREADDTEEAIIDNVVVEALQ